MQCVWQADACLQAAVVESKNHTTGEKDDQSHYGAIGF